MNAPTTLPQLLPDLDTGHLDDLEEEAIFFLREAVAAFERPALLFSAGKDSRVLLHLATKAFKTRGAEITLPTQEPLPVQPCRQDTTAGALILVDPSSHRTSAALLVSDEAAADDAQEQAA